MNSGSMSTLRASANYLWDTAKALGHGATSMVYFGRERHTGEEVAVKVFNRQSSQRSEVVQMREFDVMRKLKHENVVHLLAIEKEATYTEGRSKKTTCDQSHRYRFSYFHLFVYQNGSAQFN